MINNPSVTLFKAANHVKDGQVIKILDFLDKIQNGYWQDIVFKVRNAKSTEERNELKRNAPNATISGCFETRKTTGLKTASGLIAMDIDNLNDAVGDIHLKMRSDEYVFSSFRSISGRGLCVLFKINPKAHLESFEAISAYLYKKFNQEVSADEKCKDISRIRFVSYDPDLYLNPDSKLFKVTPLDKKERHAREYISYPTDSSTSIKVIEAIESKGVDITSNYADWINVGFALANEYKEAGREYFHKISRYHPEYDFNKTDKKYTHLLKTGNRDLNMGVIYNLATRNGIEVYSQKVKDVIKVTQQNRKLGHDLETIKSNLIKNGRYSEEEIKQLSPTIDQAASLSMPVAHDGLVNDVKLFILNNYSLKRNLITRNIELNGKPVTDIEINTIYLECRTAVEAATKDLVRSVLISTYIVCYNPFTEFLKEYKNDRLTDDNLNLLISSIKTDTPNFELFLKKWLVGIVAAIHGNHSPLMLVLCGDQNTGKTYWFRHILPEPLLPYFAECSFKSAKDDEILMTKKLIILDDELSGKSRTEEIRLKELLSKQTFSLREPYGSVSVDLSRLSVLCGTSNDLQVLRDPTGNRRVLPINILSIDQAAYNNVNKTHLFIECYNLWQAGYSHHLTREEIILLNNSSLEFEASTSEEELVYKYYSVPDGNSTNTKELTATDMASRFMSGSGIKVTTTKLGLVLKKLGFKQKHVKNGNSSARVYSVIENNLYSNL